MTVSELRAGKTRLSFATSIGTTERTVARWEHKQYKVDDPGIRQEFREAMAKLAKKMERTHG